MNMPLWIDLEGDEPEPSEEKCPKCGSPDLDERGSDRVMNVGKNLPLYTHVFWFTCARCGHKFSESYDYDI